MNAATGTIRVVDVLDEEHIVLNAGTNFGIKVQDSFMVFAQDREVKDINGKSLGPLEIVKGYGKISHVQETMCILTSNLLNGFKASPTPPPDGLVAALVGIQRPNFLSVLRGDFARPV